MADETKDMAAVTQDTAVTQPETVEAPPDVAGEQVPPADPNILGKIEPQEQSAIMALQQRNQQFIYQLGSLELRKVEVINQIGSIDDQLQGVYASIGKRLNVGPQTRWTVMADGTIRAVPDPTKVAPPTDKE